MTAQISDVVVQRLPRYVRILRRLEQEQKEVVSSQELGWLLHVTPAQIRKDLSYFGRFGKQGRGYNVSYLLTDLRRILGLEQEWDAVLVGVGRLGRAIMGYPGFGPEGFNIIGAFDLDDQVVGREVAGLEVGHINTLADFIRARRPLIGIVAVPGNSAQGVIDLFVECGIKAILNYAPVSSSVPEGIQIREIDPVLTLQSMTFYLSGHYEQSPEF